MYKAVLFDGDGVTIKGHKYFSQRLSEDFNIQTEKILPFVKNDLNLCFENKADLKDILPKYLAGWGIRKSTDEILKYWFEGENEVNQGVLDIIKKLRLNGIKCYLASDNEKYRANYITNTMGFGAVFDNMFFSYSLGLKKSEGLFFKTVINKISIPATELLHWDDDEKYNIIAKEAGVESRHYKNFDDFQRQMKSIFPFINKSSLEVH